MRREVALTHTDLQVFLESSDFDGTVTAIRVKVGRALGDNVLAAEFIFDR